MESSHLHILTVGDTYKLNILGKTFISKRMQNLNLKLEQTYLFIRGTHLILAELKVRSWWGGGRVGGLIWRELSSNDIRYLSLDLESSDWGTYHCAGYNKLGDDSKAITLTGEIWLSEKCWRDIWTKYEIFFPLGLQHQQLKYCVFLLNYLWSRSWLLTIEFVLLDNLLSRMIFYQ